tara:strand:- start:5122 stop:5451 length:330 start_codon:yes stop_codon:yes gene_type:complete
MSLNYSFPLTTKEYIIMPLFQIYKEIISTAQSVHEARCDELESIVNDFIEETVLEFRENVTQLAANNNLTDEDIQIIITGSRTSDEYKDLEDIENHEIRNVMTSTFCNF